MIIQFIYKQTFCKNLFCVTSNLKKYKEAYRSKILLDLVSCTFILITPFKVLQTFAITTPSFITFP